jgi:hypothetical protein
MFCYCSTLNRGLAPDYGAKLHRFGFIFFVADLRARFQNSFEVLMYVSFSKGQIYNPKKRLGSIPSYTYGT